LLEFLRLHRLAVQASVSAIGGAQAAIVGFAVTDQFEIVFRYARFDTPGRGPGSVDVAWSALPGNRHANQDRVAAGPPIAKHVVQSRSAWLRTRVGTDYV